MWFNDNTRLKMVLLNDTHIRAIAQVPLNEYFAIGFNTKNMKNCDMVIWLANPSNINQWDCYSTGNYQPPQDSLPNDWSTTYTQNSSHVEFVSDRKVDTGDSQDYAIILVFNIS